MWNIEKVVQKGDYLYALVRNHPNRTKNNYVLMHRVVVENHLGRLLDKNEVVHHINDNKHDNRIDNLRVMTALEHSILHGSMTQLHIVILKCPTCGKIFERRYGNTHLCAARKSKATFCSRSCSGSFNRYVQLHGITAEMKEAVSENLQGEYYGKLRAN